MHKCDEAEDRIQMSIHKSNVSEGLIEELQDEVIALKDRIHVLEHPWIPVTERLPEQEYEPVFILFPHNQPSVGIRALNEWQSVHLGVTQPTHWMPIPEVP